ncbi:hypothetical protein ACOME3_001969 [Neoechinorhynchus agilis]
MIFPLDQKSTVLLGQPVLVDMPRPWEIQSMSLKVASMVMNEKIDRLSLMLNLSSDFLLHMRPICAFEINKETVSRTEKNGDVLDRLVNPQSAGGWFSPPQQLSIALFVNGRRVNIGEDNEMSTPAVDMFDLIDLMDSEARLLSPLLVINSDITSLLRLVQLHESGDGFDEVESSIRLDFRSNQIFWMNDIERDAAYAQFSNRLYEVHGNSYHLVLFIETDDFLDNIDHSSNQYKQIISKLLGMMEYRVPIRFGIVFSHTTRYCNFLNALKNRRGGRRLSETIDDLISHATTVNTVSADITSSKDCDYNLNEKLGLGPGLHVLFNGIPLTGSQVDDIEGSIKSFLYSERERWREILSGGRVPSGNLIDYYMNHNHHLKSINRAIIDTRTHRFVEDHHLKIELDYIFKANDLETDPKFSCSIWTSVSSSKSYETAANALEFVKKQPNARLAFITQYDNEITSMIVGILKSLKTQSAKRHAIHRLLASNESVSETVKKYVNSKEGIKQIKTTLKVHKTLSNLERDWIAVNGRLLILDNPLTADDFNILSKKYCPNQQLTARVHKLTNGDNTNSLRILAHLSRFNIHSSSQSDRMIIDSPEPDFTLNTPNSTFRVDLFVDVASKEAQQVIPLVKEILVSRSIINFYLLSQNTLAELPITSLYRFSTPGMNLSFKDVWPTGQLFTVSVETPHSWMIETLKTDYDLDNLKIDSLVYKEVLETEFRLEYLLVEGRCTELTSQGSPRGLEIQLKDGYVCVQIQSGFDDRYSDHRFDTLVMANFGYFQLKSEPDVYTLSLTGQSADNYKLINDTDNGIIVRADSLHGQMIDVHAVLTGSPVTQDEQKDPKESMPEQTRVKFWFLKNFLSPQFAQFLPFYAKKYGFEYELVQYKWPRWLTVHPTEKQRLIWGFKILFLDVLFPLNVTKIIFVDADQVVRTDLCELRDLDLHGAAYGYTPFCDSRRDMEGYRFWKQGYWKTHLGSRKYHISALYVVDLIKFRQLAAGDRLRGQYFALSHDKDSLSNLDQDLPNNMIHQVDIFSLPQDWLWCETWCDDESKKRAKTIDLCNNPKTKEPKLQSAMRIIPEWTNLDNEVRETMKEWMEQEYNQNHAHHEEL